MTYKILHIAQQELFRLPEVKNFLRISHDYDDPWVVSLIDSSIEAAENFLRLSLLPRRITMQVNNPNGWHFRLPLAPIAEITALKYHKGEMSQDVAKYDVSDDILKIGNLPAYEHITVEYVAGYIDQRSIPSAIKQGIMLHTAQNYDSHGTDVALSDEVQKLYQPYRRMRV